MLEVLKDFKYYIIGGIGILALVFFVGFGFVKNKQYSQVEEVSTVQQVAQITTEDVKEEISEPSYFYIDIKGAVKKPGVYKVLEGTIIGDAIDMAGLKSTATTKNINLSKKVSDEMVINVLTSSELKKLENSNSQECNCEEEQPVKVTTCDTTNDIEVPKEKTTVEVEPKPVENDNLTVSSKVNINTASKEELMTLTGIGESKATAIIDYRSKNGGFKCPEEIMNVSGIGEALYNKIKDNITI